MKNKGYYYPYLADIFSQLHWVDVLLMSWTNFGLQHELCCTLAILLLTMSWVSAGQLLSGHWLFFKEYWKIRLLVKYLHVFRWFTSHLLMERVKKTRRFHPDTSLGEETDMPNSLKQCLRSLESCPAENSGKAALSTDDTKHIKNSWRQKLVHDVKETSSDNVDVKMNLFCDKNGK